MTDRQMSGILDHELYQMKINAERQINIKEMRQSCRQENIGRKTSQGNNGNENIWGRIENRITYPLNQNHISSGDDSIYSTFL